jgi:hypothetical protein
MMKIFAFLAALMVVISLAGCNYDMLDTNYKFDKAYVSIGGETQEVYIRSWCDYENSDMMQVTTKDGNVILTHSSNIILVG